MTVRSSLSAILSALRHPNYRLYATGNAISLVGTWMQRLTVGWLAWELTGSGVWLGLIAFSDLFPTVVAAPFAGTLADRRDRLRILNVTQRAAMAHALLLFGATVTGVINIWLLFALTLFLGTVSAFDQPARLALVPSLVPRADIPVAVAINSIVFNLARFIGPAVAGLLLYWSGPSIVFASNAVSFIAFLVILSKLDIVSDNLPAARSGNFMQRMAEGLRYLVTNAGLRVLLVTLIAVSVGGRPIVELLPGFAADVFRSGSTSLAILTASMGVGAMLAGLSINAQASPRALVGMIVASAALLAIAILVFVSTSSLWIAVPALVVAGFGMARASISAQTAIQLSVKAEMRGRVLAIYGLIFRGGPALGALGMGLASAQFGLRWPVVAGAALLLGGCCWAFPQREHIIASLEEEGGA
ncbi:MULTISPECIES: MFS transporter [unclassified Shinella]|uniref:MFS transporter n=1 Tax=Shinella TaxID=323620 RepID=UPI00225D9810|nr:MULTISPECIES: MFS transporter [unclassified Shinella]MCO5136423.1 MFS transporter [Shinella sp.]MDC7253900.1 MFS transporter [Shinella sp. YE25]CAI0336553.1 MFS transporter [Rhizobiaceae bacterium]CAK7255087.1 MFS transporter, DHA3 family, macrolide efflux protein [Shinella sp. WSC3-e]